MANKLPAPKNNVYPTIKTIPAALHEHGWLRIPAAGAQKFIEFAALLGEVIHQTEVMIKPKSRGLVTSAQPLDFHTDHSKADYVAWLCEKPATEGGETLLADAREAFLLLDKHERKTLEAVMLKEHRMFAGDPLCSPLVSNNSGRIRFYYSFWLADKEMPRQQRQAFDAFRRALATIPYYEFKLQQDDILIVDNSFILHGRRAIKDSSRQLRRFWIRSTHKNQPTGENHATANHPR